MGLGQKPKNIGKVIIGINLQKHLCHVLLVTEMFFIKKTAVSMTAALILLIHSWMFFG